MAKILTKGAYKRRKREVKRTSQKLKNKKNGKRN